MSSSSDFSREQAIITSFSDAGKEAHKSATAMLAEMETRFPEDLKLIRSTNRCILFLHKDRIARLSNMNYKKKPLPECPIYGFEVEDDILDDSDISDQEDYEISSRNYFVLRERLVRVEKNCTKLVHWTESLVQLVEAAGLSDEGKKWFIDSIRDETANVLACFERVKALSKENGELVFIELLGNIPGTRIFEPFYKVSTDVQKMTQY